VAFPFVLEQGREKNSATKIPTCRTRGDSWPARDLRFTGRKGARNNKKFCFCRFLSVKKKELKATGGRLQGSGGPEVRKLETKKSKRTGEKGKG